MYSILRTFYRKTVEIMEYVTVSYDMVWYDMNW